MSQKKKNSHSERETITAKRKIPTTKEIHSQQTNNSRRQDTKIVEKSQNDNVNENYNYLLEQISYKEL